MVLAKIFSESIWQEPFARDNDVINTHISNFTQKLSRAKAAELKPYGAWATALQNKL